ncbi:MAG: M48 family metalloprotease [Planctomycetes bacterium]|nr:M48 family metalloprotease [Planctomycetota bacterium]
MSLAALILPLLAACATDRQVIEQASSAHDQLDPAVVKDPEMVAYIQAMGTRIVDQARELHEQNYGPKAHFKEDADWMFSDAVQFHFVNSKTLNAFTTGGEHMYIYTELLKTCRTEDELAAVMAHEYAHIYGRHVGKGMDRRYWNLGGALALGVGGYALGGKKHGLEYGTAAATLGFVGLEYIGKGFTREDEAEADELGFEFYTRAGWDPQRFGDFFQQLIDKGFDVESDAASDHPTLRSRVAAAKARASKLPPDAARYRRPPVADAARFAAMKQRAELVARTMPNDETLETAQTLLAAVASCVAPTDTPDQRAARERIKQAVEEREKAEAAPRP